MCDTCHCWLGNTTNKNKIKQNNNNKTRLNAFTRSCLFKSIRRTIPNQHKLILSYSPGGGIPVRTCKSVHCVVFSPQKLFGGLAPIWVWWWKLYFPRYRLVKVSWKSVQPFPRTVVSYCGAILFLWHYCGGREKKQKNAVKHIRIRAT